MIAQVACCRTCSLRWLKLSRRISCRRLDKGRVYMVYLKWLSKRLVKFGWFDKLWKIGLILVHAKIALWSLWNILWTVTCDLSLLKMVVCSLCNFCDSSVSYSFGIINFLWVSCLTFLSHHNNDIVVRFILWKFVNLILILRECALSS